MQGACLAAMAAVTASSQVRDLPFKQTSQTLNEHYGFKFDIGEGAPGYPAAVLDNESTNVQRSVAVGSHIIVFGSIGSAAGLVTFFDGNSGAAVAELISYNAALSPGGQYIAFRRFFPRSTEFALVRDTIAVLAVADLPRAPAVQAASAGSHKRAAPVLDETLGHDLYPPQPEPGSLFFGRLIWAERSNVFYFAQHKKPNSYVVGRAAVEENGWWRLTLSRPQLFKDETTNREAPGEISAFDLDAAGMICVGMETWATPGSSPAEERAFFDPRTLEPLPPASSSRNDIHAFHVPWPTQRSSLVSPSEIKPLHIGTDIGAVRIRLVISIEGRVTAVEGQLSRSVLDSIRNQMADWKFKPTMLNGNLTAVTTVAELTLVQ